MFVNKKGSVMTEYQDLETRLNLIKDFTGSRLSMSITTSYGTRSDNDFGFLLLLLGSESDIGFGFIKENA